MTNQTKVVLATEITTAWLANPHTSVDPDAVKMLLTTVHNAIQMIADAGLKPVAQEPMEVQVKPAVTAKASLKIVGRIISMIDGKPYSSLNRHLKAHGLTAEEYRKRFSLPVSYPMVAPAYSEARRAMANRLGLGRKPKEATSAAEVEPAQAPPGKSASKATKAARAHLAGATVTRPKKNARKG